MSQQIQRHILSEYSIVKKIGHGAYSHVWRIIDKSTKKMLALKKIFDAFQHSTDAQRTYRQIRILFDLKHENIISLERVIRSHNDKDLYLVFGIMQADLYSAISDNILQEIHFKYITMQVLRALKYLHSSHLIYRDLKPSNILLNSDCRAKLCDFGLVRSISKDDEDEIVIMTEDVANRWYRAPQILFGSKNYGPAADMWSMGCIIAQMYRGKPMFNGSNTMEQIEKIISFTGRPSPEDLESIKSKNAEQLIHGIRGLRVKPINDWIPKATEQARNLIAGLLQFNPYKRLTTTQAIRFPFLRQFFTLKEEVTQLKLIRPDINDNIKLSVKDYKLLIYQWIRDHYIEPEGLLQDRQKQRKKPEQEKERTFKEIKVKDQKLFRTKSLKNQKDLMNRTRKHKNTEITTMKKTFSSMNRGKDSLYPSSPYFYSSQKLLGYPNKNSSSKFANTITNFWFIKKRNQKQFN